MAEIRTAMRMGAYDYILKDGLCEELVLPPIEELRDRQRLEQEVIELRARQSGGARSALVGVSRAMERLRGMIQRVALSDRPVLVYGPTGSGKELVVRAIHAAGANPQEPLLDLNCGAIPESLIEAQLFGHAKGAFTGADRKQDGYLTAVGRGTLFLDEIGELPLPLQAKLLRVLETGRFRPVGSTVELQLAGRVVAATHVDLKARVERGQFREDLFYRLNVLVVPVPPLDDHREDIPLLVAQFCRQQERALRFHDDAMQMLMEASWPGNVRQLRNLIDRLSVFAEDDLITRETLASHVESAPPASVLDSLSSIANAVLSLAVPNKLQATEDALVAEAMRRAEGNKSQAARLLGVHRKMVERRIGKDSPLD
jgi:DNA-binding NtrC family response regulator